MPSLENHEPEIIDILPEGGGSEIQPVAQGNTETVEQEGFSDNDPSVTETDILRYIESLEDQRLNIEEAIKPLIEKITWEFGAYKTFKVGPKSLEKGAPRTKFLLDKIVRTKLVKAISERYEHSFTEVRASRLKDSIMKMENSNYNKKEVVRFLVFLNINAPGFLRNHIPKITTATKIIQPVQKAVEKNIKSNLIKTPLSQTNIDFDVPSFVSGKF